MLAVLLAVAPIGCSGTASAPAIRIHQCTSTGTPPYSLPDPVCTPGVVDPRVTQANIHSTICVSGYTSTVRPAVSYTNRLKLQQMLMYGFTDSPSLHEEDHLIPLELGGAPSDPKNLWPEPGASFNPKDLKELTLKGLVCSGRMPLAVAQQRIATDWLTA